MVPLEWYYAKDNKQQGPVSAAELKQLAVRGALGPDDLVWREGMEGWAVAGKVKGLFDGSEPASSSGSSVDAPAANQVAAATKPIAATTAAPAATTAAPTPSAGGPHEPARHLFDVVLEFARRQLTSQFIETTNAIFTLGGYYGLYLAMLLLLPFSLFLGVKMKQAGPILLGMVAIVVLLVLQYAAGRFCEALARLNRSTPARLASTAILDCCALVAMFGGLVLLLTAAVVAVQVGPLSLVGPAIAAFILCQYVAVLALNPDSVNLLVASEATAGEEAIGVLSFLAKVVLRIAPVAFGVGVLAGTLALIYGIFLILAPPENPGEAVALPGFERVEPAELASSGVSQREISNLMPAMATVAAARSILIASALIPLAAYVVFLVSYLSIDVLRAILSLPRKLDELRPGEEQAEKAAD
jgi:hypothetical protein